MTVKVVNLQASITGYGDRAVSLLAGLDLNSRRLLIKDEKPFEDAQPGYLRIANGGLPSDDIFTTAILAAAIEAWTEFDQNKMVKLEKAVARFVPSAMLQVKSMSVSGPIWEIDAQIKNGQIAVLALCYLASRQLKHTGFASFVELTQTNLYELQIL